MITVVQFKGAEVCKRSQGKGDTGRRVRTWDFNHQTCGLNQWTEHFFQLSQVKLTGEALSLTFLKKPKHTHHSFVCVDDVSLVSVVCVILNAPDFCRNSSSPLHESFTHLNALILESFYNKTDKSAVQILCCYRTLLIYRVYHWSFFNITCFMFCRYHPHERGWDTLFLDDKPHSEQLTVLNTSLYYILWKDMFGERVGVFEPVCYGYILPWLFKGGPIDEVFRWSHASQKTRGRNARLKLFVI